MNTIRRRLTLAMVTVVFSSQAHAYLDPATGSILLQGLLAAVAGVAVTARLYWQKIKSLFSRGEPEVSGAEGERETVDPKRESGHG